MKTWLVLLVATLAIMFVINAAGDTDIRFGDVMGIAQRIEALQ